MCAEKPTHGDKFLIAYDIVERSSPYIIQKLPPHATSNDPSVAINIFLENLHPEILGRWLERAEPRSRAIFFEGLRGHALARSAWASTPKAKAKLHRFETAVDALEQKCMQVLSADRITVGAKQPAAHEMTQGWLEHVRALLKRIGLTK